VRKYRRKLQLPVAGRRKRKRGASLGEEFLACLVHYLGIVLAIYIKEVLLGFLPLEGFPG
jgi:hypothetical protein